MFLQQHGETKGGKRSSPATTLGQRLSPFTGTKVPQAIKHKILHFQNWQLHPVVLPGKVTAFKCGLCGKSLADKTPRGCKHCLNIASGRAGSQEGAHLGREGSESSPFVAPRELTICT